MKKWRPLLIGIVVCQSVGVIGGLITRPEISSWYVFLNKPSWTPPAWVFAPVWTVLYIMMGISVGLVLQGPDGDREIRFPVGMFILQLIMNLAWSVLFFSFHLIGLALVEILFLWIVIGITILSFGKQRLSAALLLVPYWVWVGFASVLNYGFLRMNP